MSASVATVGRRKYAVGLYWENSPTGRVAQAAKEAARQPGQKFDYYTVRPGSRDGRVPQFGLGLNEMEHKAGMPSFAGCLANQQPGSWAGAFRLREGTVVTVVRDELIVPDGDQLYLDETAARDRLLQEVGFGGLQKVFAPESWAIPGADTMPISLLMDERRDIVLRPVAVPKNVKIFGGVTVLLVVLITAGGWYYQKEQERLAQEEAEHQEAIRKAQEIAQGLLPGQIQQAPKYPDPDPVWQKQPKPMDVINACVTGVGKLPAAVYGWHMGSVSCTGKSVSTTWSLDKGFSSVPKGFVIDVTGNSATQSIVLGDLAARGAENLLDPQEITKRYLTQNWPGSIAREADDPPPPPPPNYQGQWSPPPPPWVKRSFTFTVQELPGSVPGYIGDIPGVIVQSIDYAPAQIGGTWTIKGVIYENRK